MVRTFGVVEVVTLAAVEGNVAAAALAPAGAAWRWFAVLATAISDVGFAPFAAVREFELYVVTKKYLKESKFTYYIHIIKIFRLEFEIGRLPHTMNRR